MDDERLDELAQSIKSNGVIQPIVCGGVGEKFQIIAANGAGARRKRPVCEVP
jgi:ParB-like chromosome segregation protein Spo0J